jgi:hypothetical protein
MKTAIFSIDISETPFKFRGKISDGLLIDVKGPFYLDKHFSLVSFDLTHDGFVIHDPNNLGVSLYNYNALIPDENGILDAVPMTKDEFKDVLPLLEERFGVYGFISCEPEK